MNRIPMPSPRGTNREHLYMPPTMALDEKGDVATHDVRKARRESLDDHLDNSIEDDAAREKARQLIDALVEACLPEAEGGMSQDSGARVGRSRLDRQFGAPNPSTWVR